MEFMDYPQSQKHLEEQEMEAIEVEVVQNQGYNANGEFIDNEEIPANQLGMVDISDSPQTMRAKLRSYIKRKNNRPSCLESDEDEDVDVFEDDHLQQRERVNREGYERDLERMAQKYGRQRTTFLPPPPPPPPAVVMEAPHVKTVTATTQTPPMASKSLAYLLPSPNSSPRPSPSKQARQDLNEATAEPEKLMPVHDQNVITKGSYLLPSGGGRQKENIAYEFGNPQYRAVLGHNTIFKVKFFISKIFFIFSFFSNPK